MFAADSVQEKCLWLTPCHAARPLVAEKFCKQNKPDRKQLPWHARQALPCGHYNMPYLQFLGETLC